MVGSRSRCCCNTEKKTQSCTYSIPPFLLVTLLQCGKICHTRKSHKTADIRDIATMALPNVTYFAASPNIQYTIYKTDVRTAIESCALRCAHSCKLRNLPSRSRCPSRCLSHLLSLWQHCRHLAPHLCFGETDATVRVVDQSPSARRRPPTGHLRWNRP